MKLECYIIRQKKSQISKTTAVVVSYLKNKMKIINIKGGLGNQMFQYAYGRALELAGEKVIFSTFFVKEGQAKIDTARDFKLNNFNIKTKAEFTNNKYRLQNLVNRIKNKLGLRENGWWQSERYFKNIESNISQEFTLKNPLPEKYSNIIKQVTGTQSVSVHVRRGDYVNNLKTKALHNVCDLGYYKRAIDIIKAQINNPTFFVFSDDIDWAAANLPVNPNAYYVSNLEGEDYEELILMSMCKNNIISNSTFSWWGAWLNQNPNKIVIAPKQWFVNKTSDEIDILPKSWIQI
jgi:hypothetical protein